MPSAILTDKHYHTVGYEEKKPATLSPRNCIALFPFIVSPVERKCSFTKEVGCKDSRRYLQKVLGSELWDGLKENARLKFQT
jgi:hypothetical protein